LSQSEIGRILRSADIRPHRVRYWLHSQDPDFAAKVNRICQLYTRPPPGATILCIDEKTCIQALGRRRGMVPAGKGRSPRFEYEYRRHGTTNLIAAFEVKTGKVFGQCRPTRKAEDLLDFMEAVAARYPGTVYVVWDNLNIHHGPRWDEFNARHGDRFRFVFTPVHASWMNQIEIWFGILQRAVIRYGIFWSVSDLRSRISGFIRHWNRAEAHPFRWTFRGSRKRMKSRRAG
jgi:hypothetical protein